MTICNRNVLLVTFDSLSADWSRKSPDLDPHIQQVISELLDPNAFFFEQHYSQLTTCNSAPFAALGTFDEFGQLTQMLNQLKAEVLCIRVDEVAGCRACNDLDAFLNLRNDQSTDGCVCSGSFTECLESSRSARLVWVHLENRISLPVTSPMEQAAESQVSQQASVLRQLFLWRDQQIAEGSGSDVIVTSLRGGSRRVAPPFETVFAEDIVRTPLWIMRTPSAYGRVPVVTGSRDLLPSLMQLLSGSLEVNRREGDLNDRNSSADDLLAEDSPKSTVEDTDGCEFRTGAVSLLGMCEAPGLAVKRVVRIQSDDGEAIHTGNFLIVRPAGNNVTGSSHGAALAVYLKPEDVWNVSDQASVYQDVVAQAELDGGFPVPDERIRQE